jgi:hypothetical protein
VGWQIQLRCDPVQRGTQILQNGIVAETQHGQSQSLKNPVSIGIVFLRAIVRRPIYLHNQPRGMAVEVRDEPGNCLLTPKVHPA